MNCFTVNANLVKEVAADHVERHEGGQDDYRRRGDATLPLRATAAAAAAAAGFIDFPDARGFMNAMVRYIFYDFWEIQLGNSGKSNHTHHYSTYF